MENQILVLIVEDLPTDAELNKREVRRVLPQSKFHIVETREAFLEALESFRPDLILSDFKLPQFDGLTALLLAKEYAPDIPFIIVTGSMNEDTAVDCMKAGAWDYIIKEHIKRLGPAVLNSLKQKKLRLDRKLDQNKMEQLSKFPSENPNAVLRIDADGTILYANAASEVMLHHWNRETGQVLPDNFLQYLSQAQAAGKTLDVEVTTENRILLLTITPIDSQKYVNIYGRDITERKLVAAEKDRLLAAIDQAEEVVMITNVDGIIQYVNPAFEHITGYSCHEAIGQTPRILNSGRQDIDFYKELWQTLISGGNWSGHFINRKKDGTFYTEEATISPVKDAAGKIVNYVAVKHDVTEELKLENQLRQSQKMESIGQLVGGVAHDFNNILQVIISFTDIAQMQLESGRSARESLNEITAAGGRAQDLIQQLLTFSRQQVIDPQDLDLNAEIQCSQQMLRRVIGEHIQLNFMPAKNLSPVFADKGQINQVLMNLCINARDAMTAGGTLTIKTAAIKITPKDLKLFGLSQAGNYILLSIDDTGCGMDKATCDRIFDPFFTTKDLEKGTGLGLSTVYGIVKQNGGHISVYSEKGSGTILKIYLPVRQSHSTDEINLTPEPIAPAKTGTETILVAEDDEAILSVATYFLSAAGYKVLKAQDGEEAVRVFEEHAEEIDCIMMDVVMPNMGGKEAMDLILKKRPDVPYLFCSGYSQDAGHNDFIKDKRQYLLSKPYRSEALLSKIREVLDA